MYIYMMADDGNRILFASRRHTRPPRYNIAVVDRRFNKLVVHPVGPAKSSIFVYYFYILIYIYTSICVHRSSSSDGDGCALLCTPPRTAIIIVDWLRSYCYYYYYVRSITNDNRNNII